MATICVNYALVAVAQGNRVKKLCDDEACEEVVIPSCAFAAGRESLPGALWIRLRAMCLMVVKLGGAIGADGAFCHRPGNLAVVLGYDDALPFQNDWQHDLPRKSLAANTLQS